MMRRGGRRMVTVVVVVVTAVGMPTAGSRGMSARAEDLGAAIDLTAFDEPSHGASSLWDDIPLHDVARRSPTATAPRRFYISGMIGPSFANSDTLGVPGADSSDTLFNAGGAIGVAFERERGRLRLEVEGMGRSTYDGPLTALPFPGFSTILTNNWSVMQNVWRDVMITDRFGLYGGGGIGGGGYLLGSQAPDGGRFYLDPGAAFAWQAGGGLLWQLSDRITFDVGYRYFQIDAIQQSEFVIPNQFAASEVMFTLRFYEPLRSWRR